MIEIKNINQIPNQNTSRILDLNNITNRSNLLDSSLDNINLIATKRRNSFSLSSNHIKIRKL